MEVNMLLRNLGLPEDSPLSVVCVEMLPLVFSLINRDYKRSNVTTRGKTTNMEDLVLAHLRSRYSSADITEEQHLASRDYQTAAANYLKPLSDQLGNFRILRTSHLIPVPEICCVDCD